VKLKLLKHLFTAVHPDTNTRKLQQGLGLADSKAVQPALTALSQVVSQAKEQAERF